MFLAFVAFVAMEPITYLTHRFVMHGLGQRLHLSHHRVVKRRRLEANDCFPVAFAASVCTGLFFGFNHETLRPLVSVGFGVTAYGLAYALVHDVYIHRRLPVTLPEMAHLKRLGDAHELHHRFNGEPYGMLWPVVPRRVREQAARHQDNGSAPSQVPDQA